MLLGAVERSLAEGGVRRAGEELVLVACSGGVDSVVLAHAVSTLLGGRRVVVAHVDHGIRPGSVDDAAAVARFAERLGAEHAERRVKPASDSEGAMREARYEALEAMREESGAEMILTAHTEDDQAETVLMALVRDAHVEALAGIPRARDRIRRPILDVPRTEVLAYAAKHGLEWQLDETNLEPRYLRNRVRKELLPLLERRYRPGIRRRLARIAESIGVSERNEPADVPKVNRARTVNPPVRFERRPWAGGEIPDGRVVAAFDASEIGAIEVRQLAHGDRIRPFGFGGRRKVRDVLREAGIPAAERPRTWVVAVDGEVVWVPGLLRSDAAPIRETTKDVWVFWTEETGSVTLSPAPYDDRDD